MIFRYQFLSNDYAGDYKVIAQIVNMRLLDPIISKKRQPL